MRENIHTIVFTVICISVLLLGILPWTFEWTNRIEPWILNLPFSLFCLIILNVIVCILMAVWYRVDSIKGHLDFDIDEAKEEERRLLE